MADCKDWDYKSAVWSYYRFEPSIAAAVIFAILFFATTALHVLQLAKTRTWYLIALVVGGCFEVVGYIGRLLGALQHPGCWTLGPYIMQSVLILVAPTLMAASVYMILGRIILLTGAERHSPIRRTWLTKIFVVGDVISLLMQGAGSGFMAIGEDLSDIGKNIVIGGLFVQLAFFGCFVVVSAVLHRRLGRDSLITPSLNRLIRWKHYLYTLYVVSGLIWIRSVFRVAEYIDGNDGLLMSSEWYVYVFDGVLMLVAFVWLNWFHPSEIGILLRGQVPPAHGLQLLKRRSVKDDMVRLHTAESLAL